MEEMGLRFYPGTESAPALPLARYLPPLPAGMVSGWLEENVAPGSWLLDPLGASPSLVLEAARTGYRVIAACNNPIVSFMIETLARAPRSAEIQSALAELAMARRGDERLEKHIQKLYLTSCENCGGEAQAQAFLWRKGEPQPYARLYRCPHCNEAPTGERPIAPKDLERLQSMGGDRLQRERALQRVILNDDDHRADVEEALESYLSRPLYVLFTLLNKVEGLGAPPERTRLLQALMIGAFDAGNTLWPWPGGRSRPRQLTVPPQIRENNLWTALEEAAGLWASTSPAVPVTHWPNLPEADTGGICLFRGRVKALMPLPAEVAPQAVITAFPRPNQAFWTLSVLWTGWLWGAEAALPLRNVLDRRRYDWNWHTSAMHSALTAVAGSLAPETPFFGLLSDLVPGFLSAAVIACQTAGFDLQGLAMRSEQELAQGLWRPANSPLERRDDLAGDNRQQAGAQEVEQTIRSALRADLETRGEPAPYLVEYAAGLRALAQSGAVPRSTGSLPGDLLTGIQTGLARTFADRSFLKLYGSQSEEVGWWWLARAENRKDLPLTDQIEVEVVRFLQRQPESRFTDLEQSLCSQFRGLLSPSPEVVQACLESYGERTGSGGGNTGGAGGGRTAGHTGGAGKAGGGYSSETWRMRTSEMPAARRGDLQDMRDLLAQVGGSLDLQTHPADSAMVWTEEDGTEAWRFYLMASSLISRYVLDPPERPPERMVLVLPGSRARLLTLKFRRDPRLAEAVRGWRVLKFRHLREIAARSDLDRDLWESLLDEDPLTEEATQMRLFSNE